MYSGSADDEALQLPAAVAFPGWAGPRSRAMASPVGTDDARHMDRTVDPFRTVGLDSLIHEYGIIVDPQPFDPKPEP
jgi:hypothetical protein